MNTINEHQIRLMLTLVTARGLTSSLLNGTLGPGIKVAVNVPLV